VGFERAFAARVKGIMHMVLKYEYVDGDTLRIFTEIDRLNGNAMLDIGVSVFSALAFLHSNGLVHRDIKPDNIMFNKNTNRVTVLDLGFACFFDGRGPVSCFEGPIRGSLTYLSPEVLRRDLFNQIPTAEELLLSDVWAFGVILLRLVTLREPAWFLAKTPAEMRQKLVGRGQEAILECVRMLLPYAIPNGEYEWVSIQTMDLLHLDSRPRAAEMKERFERERYRPDRKIPS
jgi:serine/threonine protein kinase